MKSFDIARGVAMAFNCLGALLATMVFIHRGDELSLAISVWSTVSSVGWGVALFYFLKSSDTNPENRKWPFSQSS
jgi:hypothetical protein